MVAPQPFFRARGTPFSVLHRIRALLETGHSVDLVTYPIGEDIALPGLTILRSGKPPFVNDVKIGPSISKLFLDFALYSATVRQLRQSRYDVLHTHEEAAFFGPRLARKFELIHVYDMHSSLPQQLGNFGSFNLAPLRWVFERLERYVLKNSDGVITICSDLADVAVPLCDGVPHSMIENTGDDAKVFTPEDSNIREQLGLDKKKVLVYTGTLEPYQGIDILLRAFKLVVAQQPDVHLVVVGGREGQVAGYQDMARELGIGKAVSFTGMVSPAKIPAFVRLADVIVSPRSSGTNTPLKIYGYLRAGCPLVATNLATHTQVLDDNVAHLVDPTPEAFAEGICTVLRDDEYRRRLAEAARQRAEQEFADEHYVAKVAGFYEDVLAHLAPRDAGTS